MRTMAPIADLIGPPDGSGEPPPLPASRWPDPAFDARLFARAGGRLCGVDEVGRGPWAGPVVTAAVVLDRDHIPDGLADSKLVSPAERERLFAEIIATADVAIGMASVERIDRTDIRKATLWAMARAVAGLAERPTLAVFDGRDVPPGLSCAGEALIDGDMLSQSIAAASIVAKVARDRLMSALSESFPDYGFERHKGYGTAAHQAALARFGITPHHRRSFAPIRKLL
ncbi:ribonuclease HII [Pseudoxanthobacter soli]|nr:ribonuclease HII [Pseudoxanthobacter soli]